MNPEEIAKRLMGVIARLSGLLKDENDRLSVPGRAKGLPEIVKEKETLSRVYEQQVKILSNKELTAKISPDLRTRLAEAAISLGKLMEENRLKLQSKLDSTKTVLRIMADAAKEFRAASGGYGPSGAVGADARQARQAYHPPISLGVNREL